MSGYLRSRAGVVGEHSAAIDALFAEYDRDRVPGVNIAVVHGDRVVHQRGYGVADVENDVPFTGRTVLRLGSTTKHLCAACLLILEDRGALSLDDDVRRYVDGLPDFGAPITLRHLLTMTSGLRDGLNMLLFAGLGVHLPVTRAHVLELLRRERTAMFRPGDDVSYSNTNYALASLVVERVAGRPLAEFMADEIFRPLGMADAALVPWTTHAIARAARGYVPAAGGGYDAGLMLVELSGDGGVAASLDDMVAWYRAYRDGALLPDLRERLERTVRLNDGREIDYRLGVHVSRHQGLLQVGHAGGMPGYLCDFVMHPEHDLCIVLFSNVFDIRVFEAPPRIADLILHRPAAAPSLDAAPATGFFANAERGLVVELDRREGRGICHLLGEAHPLDARGRGEFVSAKRGAAVMLRARGDDVELQLGCLPWLPMTRTERPHPRGGVDLGRYAGTYASALLGERHRVEAVDGRLEVSLDSPLRSLVWRRMLPVGGDLFTSEIDGEASLTNVQMLFARDAAGRVRGFRYHLARCTDVEFERVEAGP